MLGASPWRTPIEHLILIRWILYPVPCSDLHPSRLRPSARLKKACWAEGAADTLCPREPLPILLPQI